MGDRAARTLVFPANAAGGGTVIHLLLETATRNQGVDLKRLATSALIDQGLHFPVFPRNGRLKRLFQ